MYNQETLPPLKSPSVWGFVRSLAVACGAGAGAFAGLIAGGTLGVVWVGGSLADFEEAGEEAAIGAAVVFMAACLTAIVGASFGLWVSMAATASRSGGA
jgi:hypothetical protein